MSPPSYSLSEDLSADRNQTTGYAITHTVQLTTRPLARILEEYLPEGVKP